MSKIADVIEIPENVHAGDCVLHLSDGVNRPERTLDDYVVTPALVDCFEEANPAAPTPKSVSRITRTERLRVAKDDLVVWHACLELGEGEHTVTRVVQRFDDLSLDAIVREQVHLVRLRGPVWVHRIRT